MAAIEAMKMVSRNVILRIFIGIMVLMGGELVCGFKV